MYSPVQVTKHTCDVIKVVQQTLQDPCVAGSCS